MSNLKLSIDAKLMNAQVAIDNSLSDDEVQNLVSAFGYTPEKLGEGKTLLEEAQNLHNQQKVEYSEQYEATDALKKKWDEAKAEYMKFIKIARIALRDNTGAYKKLGLEGVRKVSLSGWISQARQFYDNALADPDIMTALGEFAVTQEKLQAGAQLVDDTEAANNAHEKERG